MMNLFLVNAASFKLNVGWSKTLMKILEENQLDEIVAAIELRTLLKFTTIFSTFKQIKRYFLVILFQNSS